MLRITLSAVGIEFIGAVMSARHEVLREYRTPVAIQFAERRCLAEYLGEDTATFGAGWATIAGLRVEENPALSPDWFAISTEGSAHQFFPLPSVQQLEDRIKQREEQRQRDYS